LTELHIAKGHDLHCLPGITRISNDGIWDGRGMWPVRWEEKAYTFMWREYEEKRILGKHRNRWIVLEWIYLSTRTSSITRWNRLLLTCRNNFVIMVVKKNKTHFTSKTHLCKPNI
jgi:hypothetical protein